VSAPTSRGGTRERGGTFTFASLLLSALLLISAGLLTGQTRTTYRSAAGASRHSSLREAAFAGGTWAALKSKAQPVTVGDLALGVNRVAVTAKRDDKGRLVVTSSARNAIGEAVTFSLRYSAKGALEHFETLPNPEPKKAGGK
jgi:hypothetical protein